LKTSEKITGKILTEKETPPTHPHKNLVKSMSITDQSFNDYRKSFWTNTTHGLAK
jgi:hypothetical protein